MAANIEKIALSLPIVVSSGVFAGRRTDKFVDNVDNNPVYGVANLMIAGGQTLKAVRAAKEVAIAAEPSAAESIKTMSKSVETASKASKSLKVFRGLFDFISKHINPLICLTSVLKVLFGADDKVEAGCQELGGLAGMFLFEHCYKELAGLSYTKEINGKMVSCPREALYHRNPFAEKQVNALKEYCATKKLFGKVSLKAAPSVLKGLFFVGASIAGYSLGSKGVGLLFKKSGSDESGNQNSVQMNYNSAYNGAAAA